MAEGGPPDYETQKTVISELLKTPLKKGDVWYLIDTKWFKQWKKYVGFDSWDTRVIGEDISFPGPIDNAPLFKDGTCELKEHLIDELDYMLVPTEAWEKMVSWYGIVGEQEPIARTVIEQGMFVKQCKVEVYLMDLKLCQNNEMDKVLTKRFSRADTIEHIEKEMKELFSISDDKEVRLWNKYMSNTYEHLNKPENTLQDAGLYQGQMIVVEQQNDDGTWPRQTKSTSSYSSSTTSMDMSSYGSSPVRSSGGTTFSSYNSNNSGIGGGSSSSSYYGSSSYDYNTSRGSVAPGLCGLSNLGNTCFMNSAIQCMSNVPQLTQYFLEDKWQDELNYDNPLGMKGEIAKAYAELIKNMWSGKYSYSMPRNFKIAVGRFAPQFSGYQQQDSQELMAFLLDGLHEDLNRIKKKPYIEQKDDEGREDLEVALETWENYRKRNDSVIVDTFHGLLKSTLVCPQCSKISVTFDPFCYLSLPLPIKKERQIEVFFVPLDPLKKLVQYKVTVPKMGIVLDVCRELSKHTGVTAEKMVVTDVYNHRFHKVFTPHQGLSQIMDRDDIFVYEIPTTNDEDQEQILLLVYMREKRVRQSVYYSHSHTSTQLFGTPLLVPVPKKSCTFEQLYNILLHRMSRYVRPPDDENWWKSSKDEESSEEGEEKPMNGEMELNNAEDHDENMEKKSDEEEEEKEVQEEDDHRLFSISIINSYGSSEVQKVTDDGEPIKFTNRTYLAIDWNFKAKDMFYDEKLADEFEIHESVNTDPIQKKQTIQLDSCLDLFTTREKLGADDPWYCPACKKHQQATKKFDVWQLPKILVIHLKRFSYNRYLRDKLDVFVEFPARGLNLKKLVINPNHGPALYDLVAVTNHYGGLGGGHYTAYAKNRDDNEWYHFDDSTVSQCSEDMIVTKAAYVLVYQKRDVDMMGNNQNPRVISAAAGAASRLEGFSNGNCTSDDEMDIN